MYLWRKSADLQWVKAHEPLLEAHARGQLVITQKPGRKRLELKVVFRSRRDSIPLLKKFGGNIKPLSRNWLERFERTDAKPIRIGKRLVISSVGGTLTSRSSLRQGCSRIIIPASLAFGTGEHATTAMSLRLLEKLTRRWKPGWSLVDIGTGTGIFALAAKRFGAKHVVGIDNDPTAISMARSNARLNKIRDVKFQLADAHEWNSSQDADVIIANLYSGLLLQILPKLRYAGWLILSGILSNQLRSLSSALQKNHCDIIIGRRRGKWIAILAKPTRSPRRGSLGRQVFAVAGDRLYSKTNAI